MTSLQSRGKAVTVERAGGMKYKRKEKKEGQGTSPAKRTNEERPSISAVKRGRKRRHVEREVHLSAKEEKKRGV